MPDKEYADLIRDYMEKRRKVAPDDQPIPLKYGGRKAYHDVLRALAALMDEDKGRVR